MSRNDFWSRRKAAVEAEAQADLDAEEAARLQAREEQLAEKSDEDLLVELGLPEPETLTSAEQLQDFLQSELPQRLKARALRRLWRLNPVLANVDGLVDYGEDFTDAALVVENLQTAYQVGKGMLAALNDLTEDGASVLTEAEDAADEQMPEPESPAGDVADVSEPTEADVYDAPDLELAEAAEHARAPARRMQFRFEPAT